MPCTGLKRTFRLDSGRRVSAHWCACSGIGWTISPAQYVCERERERERARERDVAQSLVVLPAAALTLKLYTLIRPVIPGMLRACLPARHMVLSLH